MSKVHTETFEGVPVTPRQLDYLRAIERFWIMFGKAPSIRELGKLVGDVSTNAVMWVLGSLQDKDLIVWEFIKARTIRTKRTKIQYADGGYYVFF